ncbi:MAG: DNA-binding NarL/FixJ family response regulator [Kiritimatiellia bacterium]
MNTGSYPGGRWTLATHTHLPVVVLTAFDDPPRILAAIRADADGYLLKSSGGDELISYLREAATGGSPLTRGVARSVLDLLCGDTPAEPQPGLIPTEHDVLRLLVQGLAY